jgi:hypothetical protein
MGLGSATATGTERLDFLGTVWLINLLHAQAAPRCGARNRAGKSR